MTYCNQVGVMGHLTSRVGVVVFGSMLILFFTAYAFPARRTAEIGNITIAYDDSLIQIRPGFGPPPEGSQRLIFVPKDETGNRFPGSAVVVTAEPDDGTFMGPDWRLLDDPLFEGRPLWLNKIAPRGSPITPARDFGGLMLQGWVFHTRCRNWTPPMYIAEGVHDGIRYGFRTGLPNGCRGGGYSNGETFDAILGGVSLRPEPD